jgi:hypothetical protein
MSDINDSTWLDNLVQQVRVEAGKVGISQEEVVARLRAGTGSSAGARVRGTSKSSKIRARNEP